MPRSDAESADTVHFGGRPITGMRLTEMALGTGCICGTRGYSVANEFGDADWVIGTAMNRLFGMQIGHDG